MAKSNETARPFSLDERIKQIKEKKKAEKAQMDEMFPEEKKAKKKSDVAMPSK